MRATALPVAGGPPDAARQVSSMHWSPALEERLDNLLGPVSRRISYDTALCEAGVALIHGTTVASSKRVLKGPLPTGLRVITEPEHVVEAGSRRITRRTWMSSPARALLECAQFPHRVPRAVEYIADAVLLGAPEFDPDSVAALSEELCLRAGLRRVASVAAGLAASSVRGQLEGSPPPQWAELVPRAGRGDRWIQLNGFRPRRANRWAWYDTARRVVWPYDPDALASELLT